MTLSLITGTPGSGKSLTMAGRIRHWLKRGRLVIANFDINHDTEGYEYFVFIENRDMTPELLEQYSNDWFSTRPFDEDSILLVIDEAQIVFSARSWNDKDRAEWLYFFSQSRKYGFAVWLCTQIDTSIDKNLRLLVEYQYICRKTNNYGLLGMFVSLFMGKRPLIARVQYWYPMKQRLACDWFIGKRKDFALYDTRKRFER